MEHLLSVLHSSCPAKADALCKTRRRVEHGLTTVGLKIHSLGENWELLNLINALGGRSEVIGSRVYAHARASVGNARSAILLLECLERYFEHPIFHNPSYQIQVCSPCRLDGSHAAILAIAFYLESDVLRRYSLGDLTTTFSEDPLGGHKHRGRRIVLYDGEGDLDRDFEWWDLEKDQLSIRPQLPFVTERTDVLTCQSETDIENINLIATLLSHRQTLAYWKRLGGRFVADVEALLKRHLLQGMLEVCWMAAIHFRPPLAYWPKPKRCYSTTAPNYSPSPGDYCRREWHESASARFDANRHPRNSAQSRPYSCTRARTGAGADQSTGQGARKGNRTGVIRCIFRARDMAHASSAVVCGIGMKF
jgi:hypothetical protein